MTDAPVIHDVEQNSPEWYAMRFGMPTASQFSSIITSAGKPSKSLRTYAAQLAAEAYAGEALERWQGNQWTERGHELEDRARAEYELLTGHTVTLSGFVTRFGAGCSPDSFVNDDGLLEIKCMAAKNHVMGLAYYRKHGKCPTDYYAQVQGQMLICERDWADLWLYHPSLPCISIRVDSDAEFQQALTSQIAQVLSARDEYLAILRETA